MMTEQIVITPETIPTVCERIRAMLAGRVYRVTTGRDIERNLTLERVNNFGEHFNISDSYGLWSVSPHCGAASITFFECRFVLRHVSSGGWPIEWMFEVEP